MYINQSAPTPSDSRPALYWVIAFTAARYDGTGFSGTRVICAIGSDEALSDFWRLGYGLDALTLQGTAAIKAVGVDSVTMAHGDGDQATPEPKPVRVRTKKATAKGRARV